MSTTKYITTIGDQEYSVELLKNGQVSVNGVVYEVDFETVSDETVYSLLVNGKSFEAHAFEEDQLWHVLLRGVLYQAEVEDERERRLRAAAGASVAKGGEFVLKAPMPGLVVDIPVAVEDEVEEGQVLVVLESMKMQNELKAPHDGKVSRIRVKPGDNVERREVLMRLA